MENSKEDAILIFEGSSEKTPSGLRRSPKGVIRGQKGVRSPPFDHSSPRERGRWTFPQVKMEKTRTESLRRSHPERGEELELSAVQGMCLRNRGMGLMQMAVRHADPQRVKNERRPNK